MRGIVLISITVALAATAASQPGQAQTKATSPAPASTVCAGLMATYERTSQNLADSFASSVGDNSAPRATLRAMEDANEWSKAKMALDLMRDHRCPMPKSLPSAGPYISAALECRTARMKVSGTTTPEECKRENWKRAGD